MIWEASEPYLISYAKQNKCVVATVDMFAAEIRKKKSDEEREVSTKPQALDLES